MEIKTNSGKFTVRVGSVVKVHGLEGEYRIVRFHNDGLTHDSVDVTPREDYNKQHRVVTNVWLKDLIAKGM